METKTNWQTKISRRWVVIAGCGFLAISALTLTLKNMSSKAKNAGKIVKVERKNIVQSLQLSGKIFPEKTMVITAQQSGRIVTLDAKEGSQVAANDLLFTMQLEASGQAELMDIRSRVKTLEHEVASATKLVNNKNAVKELIGVDQVAREESDLDKLKIELSSARDRLSIVEANLGLTQPKADRSRDRKGSSLVNVRSPIQGIVTLVDKRPGDFVLGGGGSAGSGSSEIGGSNERMVMVVADMSKLQVRIKVMEADLRFIKQGLPVKVRLDAYPDSVYDGKVEQIGGQGRSEAKAGYTYFDVFVGIEQKDIRLLPEMNASVDLIFAQRDQTLTLPVSSVLILPAQSYVSVLDPKDAKGFRYIPVQTGAVNASNVEILAGLNEGDEVLEIDFSSKQIFDIAEIPKQEAKKQ